MARKLDECLKCGGKLEKLHNRFLFMCDDCISGITSTKRWKRKDVDKLVREVLRHVFQ